MKNEIINLGGKVFTCNKKFETKLRKKYFKEELEKFLNKAVPIVNSMANQYNSRLEPSKPKYKIEFWKSYQQLFPRSKSVGFAYVYYVE